jgi:hypothetical protein
MDSIKCAGRSSDGTSIEMDSSKWTHQKIERARVDMVAVTNRSYHSQSETLA